MSNGNVVKKDRGPASSVFGSFDFYIGVPLGVLVGLCPAAFSEARSGLPSLFIGIAGVGAGVATLILTAMAVLVGSVSPAYAKFLKQTKSGIPGAARPFRIVAQLAAFASAAGLVSANLVTVVGNNFWLIWLVSAVPFASILWAVFGCVQVSKQLVYHWDNSLKAEELERRRNSALKKRE